LFLGHTTFLSKFWNKFSNSRGSSLNFGIIMTCFNILQYIHRINIFSSLIRQFGRFFGIAKILLSCYGVSTTSAARNYWKRKIQGPTTPYSSICSFVFLEQWQAKLSTIVASPRVLLLTTNYMGLQHTSKTLCRDLLEGQFLGRREGK
jgi:hypothetical protein